MPRYHHFSLQNDKRGFAPQRFPESWFVDEHASGARAQVSHSKSSYTKCSKDSYVSFAVWPFRYVEGLYTQSASSRPRKHSRRWRWAWPIDAARPSRRSIPKGPAEVIYRFADADDSEIAGPIQGVCSPHTARTSDPLTRPTRKPITPTHDDQPKTNYK
jgi:hypothetical protein